MELSIYDNRKKADENGFRIITIKNIDYLSPVGYITFTKNKHSYTIPAHYKIISVISDSFGISKVSRKQFSFFKR